MPNVEYSTRLKKLDPLTTLHIKVPQSIVPIYNREGDDQQRAASFIMRNDLIEGAKLLAAKHERIDKAAKLAAARKKAS